MSATPATEAERLDVALPSGRRYPILLGEGLLGATDSLAPYISRQVLVVSNPTVANLYLARLKRSLGHAAQVHCVEIGDGEQFKTLATYAAILDALVEARYHRNATVVALGGGVVGDVAGFAAATYQRGIGLVQIPTTLLALVDSSVGGKTAVNHAAGKNLIGAFHQPRAVLADVAALRTLPMREYRAGLAEVVKYGVIADVEFFAWLEAHIDALMARDAAALLHAVRRCCQIKAAVVAADEREQGRRAILNFGHTFGHAIETLTGFRYLHGEAVAVGMAMAMELSVRLGLACEQDAGRVRRLLGSAGLALHVAGVEPQAMLTTMGMDKKALDGRLRLVVCNSLGSASVTALAPRAAVLAAIDCGLTHVAPTLDV